MAAPTVTSISPAIGGASGGVSATITGTNFTGTTGVTIGGVAATNLVVVSATSITITLPAGTAGVASVLVTNADGTNAGNSLFQYIPHEPTDTYIYLKGGRGDGFVPLWTGDVAEQDQDEQSEPYRNEFQSSMEMQNEGAAFVVGFGARASFPGVGTLNLTTVGDELLLTPTLTATPDSVQDAMDGTRPPRQFTKSVTWLLFTASSGIVYRYRKMDVIGWGSRRRDE